MRRWIAEHGLVDGWSLEPDATLHLEDTYFDTEDWRIFRAGYALRLRAESGRWEATLKSLRSASAELADRRELREDVDSPTADWTLESHGPVATRVLAVRGTSELRPLFEIRTTRQRFAVKRPEAVDAEGEIALDESVLSRPDGEATARVRRVELEALAAEPDSLRTLATALREQCGLESPGENKFSLGLKSVGLVPVPAPVFVPTAVTGTMTMPDVALANLRRHVQSWYLHESGARLGDDPEELHELRVAVRRVDALVRDFRGSLTARKELRPVLKRVLRVLGEARDLDVALGELDAFGRELSSLERQQLEPLRRHLSSERDRARVAMVEMLDSPPVRQELLALTQLLGEPAVTGEAVRRGAPTMLRKRYRRLRKAAERLRVDASAETHHALRGEVKKLRYALEAVAVIYGKPGDAMLRSLRRLQERLGVHQDAAVAAHRLQELAAAPPSGILAPTVFLMGRLAEHHERVAARARESNAGKRRRLRGRWKRLRTEFGEE